MSNLPTEPGLYYDEDNCPVVVVGTAPFFEAFIYEGYVDSAPSIGRLGHTATWQRTDIRRRKNLTAEPKVSASDSQSER